MMVFAFGDPSAAWDAWSSAVELSLADACRLAGGPLPLNWALKLGRGRLHAYKERLVGWSSSW